MSGGFYFGVSLRSGIPRFSGGGRGDRWSGMIVHDREC